MVGRHTGLTNWVNVTYNKDKKVRVLDMSCFKNILYLFIHLPHGNIIVSLKIILEFWMEDGAFDSSFNDIGIIKGGSQVTISQAKTQPKRNTCNTVKAVIGLK